MRWSRLLPALARAHVSRGPHDRAQRRTFRQSRRLRRVGEHSFVSAHERLRESEVQNLRRAVRPDLDVRWFQVPVDDPFLVRGFEAFRNVDEKWNGLVHGHPPPSQALAERLPFDELHDEKLPPL